MNNQQNNWTPIPTPMTAPAAPATAQPVWMWAVIGTFAALTVGFVAALALGVGNSNSPEPIAEVTDLEDSDDPPPPPPSAAQENGGDSTAPGSASPTSVPAEPAPPTAVPAAASAVPSTPVPPTPVPPTPVPPTPVPPTPTPVPPTPTPIPPTPTPTPVGIQLNWNTGNADDYAIGRVLTMYCPPNGTVSSFVFGGKAVDGLGSAYTADSRVCSAAVQRGLITAQQGGYFRMEIVQGLVFYGGVTRNGVTSKDWTQAQQGVALFEPAYPKSFILY